jgi:K+-transporting ATPase A subunit
VRLAGWFEISLTLALVLAAAYPIGAFMADVFDNRKTFLTPLLGPVERALYRLAGVDPEVEQKWVEYALSMVVFGGGCLFALYALLRLQAYLPLNPQGFPGVSPDLAFNIAISFITKISTREMQFALFALLLSPALILVSAGASSVLKIALDSLGVGGPHGLSEIVYAYASSAADNGSSFAGLSANTLWYNITTGLAMFFGRFAHAIPILAIAGSLAAKKRAKPSAGTMPTDGPLFIGFPLAVVAIVTLLQYLPVLALGPIAEHFLISQGSTF